MTSHQRHQLSPGTFILLALSCTVAAQAQLIANGNYFQSGFLTPTWLWQASGPFFHGRCPYAASSTIADCYSMSLGANGNLESTTRADYLATLSAPKLRRERRTIELGEGAFELSSAKDSVLAAVASAAWAADRTPNQLAAAAVAITDDSALDAYFVAFPEQAPFRYLAGGSTTASSTHAKQKRQFEPSASGDTLASSSARQRNEISSWPGAPSGQSWFYTWKSFQQSSTGTNSHFFHAWQILRRDANGGPVVTLDYENGRVFIEDLVRGCTVCTTGWIRPVDWFGKTVIHSLAITYGLNGKIDYSAALATSPNFPIMKYSATGDMGSSGSLKFGNYRLYTSDLKAAAAYVGDFTQTRIS